MASPSGASGQFAAESARDYGALVSSRSESSGSFNSDDAGSQDEYYQPDQDPICSWRTPRYYQQECSRFFDCPSHNIERSLSENNSMNQASIHSARSGGPSPPDNDGDHPHEQDGRFSDQELAQAGIERLGLQPPLADEINTIGDAASAIDSPRPNAGEDLDAAAGHEPRRSSSYPAVYAILISKCCHRPFGGQDRVDESRNKRDSFFRTSANKDDPISRKDGCTVAFPQAFGGGSSTPSTICSPVDIFRAITP
ncbi:hypothetical protein F66182_3656 [Fusarium sp. NRRL 66182]|nr:hypothetical protein F66182_3656 [Fusarium sp. NRRL 66182]